MIHAPSDRTPPYSEEAERGLLGSAIMDPGVVVPMAQAHGLTEAAFYVTAHRIIWQAIVATCEAHHGHCDALMVCEWLKTHDASLEAVGGDIFIDRLIDSTPTAAHAEYYLQTVQDKETRRAIIQAARTAEAAAYVDENAEAVRCAAEMDFVRIGEHAKPEPTFCELVDGVISDLEAVARDGVPRIAMLSTGYPTLDEAHEGGLMPGGVYYVKGDAKAGKTSLVCNIATRRAICGDHVFVCSGEMRGPAITNKLLSIVVRSSIQRALAGKYPVDADRIRAAVAQVRERIHLMTKIRSLDHVWGTCRRAVLRGGCSLVVLDYLQLLAKRAGGDEEWKQIGNASDVAVSLANELGVPFLCVSQSDPDGSSMKMRGSRQPQYDAAGIWHVHSDQTQKPSPPDWRRNVEVEIQAGRFNAFGYSINMQLIGSTGEMIEMDAPKQQDRVRDMGDTDQL